MDRAGVMLGVVRLVRNDRENGRSRCWNALEEEAMLLRSSAQMGKANR